MLHCEFGESSNLHFSRWTPESLSSICILIVPSTKTHRRSGGTHTTAVKSKRSCEGAGLEVSPWWLCFQRVASGVSLCLQKELFGEIAAAPKREKHRGRLGKRRGCFCLSFLPPPPPLPSPPSQLSTVSLQQDFFLFCCCVTQLSVSLSPRLMLMLLFDKPVVLKMCWSFTWILFFFNTPPSPRLEVCGMRLKDRFLTHGGLALWSRKHKRCGCLSVPLYCCPPNPTSSSYSSSAASSSSLPSLHSSLHWTPCPCHSLFPFSSPPSSRLHRAAGARGLRHGFYGYWLQRLDTSSQLPVVVRQPDIHSPINPGYYFFCLFLYISFTLPVLRVPRFFTSTPRQSFLFSC